MATTNVNLETDAIFDEKTQEFLSEDKRQEAINEFQATWSLPAWTFYSEPPPTPEESTAEFKEFQAEQAALQEEQVTPTLQTATPEQPVVERWTITEETTVEAPAIEVTRDAVTSAIAKSNSWLELTPQEVEVLSTFQARQQLWETVSQIFWEENTQDTAITQAEIKSAEQQAFNEKTANQEIKDLATERKERTNARISILDNELNRSIKDIEDQVSKTQAQTQRLASLRWTGRSSINEDNILELQAQWDALISEANRKAELERELIRAEEEWLESSKIAQIKSNLATVNESIQTQLDTTIAQQNEVNKQIESDFATAAEWVLSLLSAWGVEIWDYDDKASQALWYVSDSKWNPIKLDENGQPIKISTTDTIDTKISTFKDWNDNTYVYKNGALDSVITLDGNILKWEQLKTFKVPASVSSSKEEKETRDIETSLRKEFNWLDVVSDFNSIRTSYQGMLAAQKASERQTGIWDVALVFQYMKMLDPTSVVREWEFATAANTGWASQNIINSYNKALSGQFLSDIQRQEFVDLWADLLESRKSNIDNTISQYKKIAEDSWADVDFIIWDFTTWIEPSQSFTIQTTQTDDEIANSLFWWDEVETTTETTTTTFDITNDAELDNFLDF